MGIGFLELVVIAVVALVLLGPQRLPGVLSQLGRFYVQLRRTSAEFRGAVDHVVRQAEAEVRLEEIKRLTTLAEEAEKQALASEITQKQSDPVSETIADTKAQARPLARVESATDAWHEQPELIAEASTKVSPPESGASTDSPKNLGHPS